MSSERQRRRGREAGGARPLDRLEVIRALRISNWEAVFATVHAAITGGAIQTGFAVYLNASNMAMGVLGSIPTFTALVQLISSVFVQALPERRSFTAWFSLAARLLWVPIMLVPLTLPPGVRLPAFIVLFAISGILIQVPVPAFTSWLSDLVPPDHRGRYFGRRNMLAGLTVVVVSLPAGWFLDLAVKSHAMPEPVAFCVLFGVAALFGFFSFLCLLRQPEPPMVTAASSFSGLGGLLQQYRAPLTDKAFRRFLAFSGVFAVGQFVAGPFYTVYAIKSLHLNFLWLQGLGSLASLAGLLAMPLWGYLSDKFGNKPILVISVFGVAVLPLGWVPCVASQPTLTIALLTINHLAGGLFWAGVGLTQFNILIADTPNDKRPVYVGAMSAFTGALGGLSPILGGVLLSALGDVRLQMAGLTLGSFQILFIINSLIRFGSLGMMRGLGRGNEASPKEVLQQLGGIRMGAMVNMRRLQRSRTVEARSQAAEALGTSKTALAVDDLVAALMDPSRRVRADAAAALGGIGDPRAVTALMATVDDPGSGIQQDACRALGHIGDAASAETLARAYALPDPRVRLAAVEALGAVGGPVAATVVSDAAATGLETGDAALAVAALRAGERLGALPPDLVARAAESAQPAVRRAAAATAGQVGHRELVEALVGRLAAEPDPAAQAEVACAAAALSICSALPAIVAAALRCPSPIARRQLVFAAAQLAGVGDEAYRAVMAHAMERDQLLERTLADVGRMAEQLLGVPAARRTEVLCRRAVQRYAAGDMGDAVRNLARVVATVRAAAVDSTSGELAQQMGLIEEPADTPQELFVVAALAVKQWLTPPRG